MPEYCTCGTRLVEDARFCHRCGRPTAEIAAEFVPPPIPPVAAIPPVAQTALGQLPVSFSNPIALRVAFLMSLATIPVELMPGLNALFFVWWLGAGWCAVLLYRRLTGFSLSIGAGARLGSITGVLTFVGLAIGFAVTLLVAGKEFFSQMDEMAKKNPDAAQVIHDPTMMFIFLILCLGIMGAFVVGLCAAGGALGARFTARKANG
jgi:hypothetical protein